MFYYTDTLVRDTAEEFSTRHEPGPILGLMQFPLVQTQWGFLGLEQLVVSVVLLDPKVGKVVHKPRRCPAARVSSGLKRQALYTNPGGAQPQGRYPTRHGGSRRPRVQVGAPETLKVSTLPVFSDRFPG